MLLLAAAAARSSEPDGVFALRSLWDDPDHLTVVVQALVPLDEVVVTWVGPPGLALKAELPEDDRTPEKLARLDALPGGEKLALGNLPARALRTFHLRLEGDQRTLGGSSRIAVVRVEGKLRGRLIREAIGIPIGEPAEGRLRGDVLEYDAAVEPRP